MVSDLNKKRNKAGEFFNEKLLFKAAGVGIMFFIVLLVINDIKIYQKKKELMVEVQNYEKQIEAIKKSNQSLKTQIANSDNVDYLEKVAYEQLDQQRPGERQFIFVMPEEKKADASAEEKSWTGWLSGAWEKVKGVFK